MAKLTLELDRNDFCPDKFDRFEKGYWSLKLDHLKKEIYELALISHKVFIYYNGSELILKDK